MDRFNRVCNVCGIPWTGYGYTCNECKQIERLERLDRHRTYDGGTGDIRYSSSGSNTGFSIIATVVILAIVGAVLFKGNWAVGGFLFFLVKMGLYIMFGWWMGFSIPHA